MEIKKLLFVTEFEELWFDALQSLMGLKKTGMNHVVFLHVINRDDVAMQRGKGYLKSTEVKLKEMANIRFIDWAESLFEQGMEAGAHIVVGKMDTKTITVADSEDVDLIVTGYHGRGKFKEIMEGSEIMEIIQRTSKPVMVHKYHQESGKTNDNPFDRPVLAMDWSPASLMALEFIISIKEIVKEVIVIHVVNEKDVESLDSMAVQKVRKESRKKLESICEKLNSHKIKAQNHIYVGDAVSQIEKAADERQGTIIIGGTNGRETFKERVLGSIPRKLAERSELPVLFVPPEVK